MLQSGCISQSSMLQFDCMNIDHHLVTRSPGGFTRITDPTVNLVLWPRALPAEVCDLLESVSGRLRRLRAFDGPVSRDGTGRLPWLDALPPGPARDWLEADVRRQIRRLCRLGGTSRPRVFLGPVLDDQCRKFHVDHVRLRLVTTYLGPGTEWVPETAVDRLALVDSPTCPHEANARIVRDLGAVRRAAAGDVVLLKGARHGSVDGRPAVHRSPPIEGLGTPRVVLIATASDTPHRKYAP
jgi:hypothetical protein